MPRLLLAWLKIGWACGAMALLLAWAIGVAASDRWWWSQWLAWVPGEIACLVSLIGLVWLMMPSRARPRYMRRAMAVGVVLSAGMMVRDHAGWSCQKPSGGSISIAYLNARWPGKAASDFTPVLLGVDADLLVIGNCGRLGESPEAERWQADGAVLHRIGPFAVSSGVELVSSRLIYAGEFGTVGVIQTVPLMDWPDGLRVGLFDLPSGPTIERAALASGLAAQLRSLNLGNLDVAVGDFNMPAGWSLCHLLSGMHAGGACGWQGTFPRGLPLWRIDHILARDGLDLSRSLTFDPGAGAHRGVLADVSPGRGPN